MGGKIFSTIKAAVFDAIHQACGRISYKEIEKIVLQHFPHSAFKQTHWTWYRYQCTKGRFAVQFNTEEKQNLSTLSKTQNLLYSKVSVAQMSQASEIQAIPITPDILSAIKKTIHAALNYENLTGGTRKLGITGEVGEILVCHHLNLKLCIDPRAEGFDAIDSHKQRVQIKTRRSESDGLPNDAGRVGTFSKHAFDYAILAILDHRYDLAEMWQVDYPTVLPVVEKQKRHNPNLSIFKKIAKRIWPSD